jgi:hypothetical protein
MLIALLYILYALCSAKVPTLAIIKAVACFHNSDEVQPRPNQKLAH